MVSTTTGSMSSNPRGNAPRDHHFIPVFYLKQWVNPVSKKLIEYSIKHGKFIAKPVGPRGTGFETDLYSFPELPPNLAQYVEAEFFKFADDKAAIALQKHLRGETGGWTNELISAWSRFLIGMHLRHPDAMKELRPAAVSIWKNSGPKFQEQYEAIRKPEDPPTFDEKLQTLDPLIAIKMQANLIIKTFDNETLGEHINKARWAVIGVPGPHPLLTSDRPLAIYRLSRPEGFVALPISPSKLFIAANDDKTIAELNGVSAKEVMQRINVFTVSRARRYVYAIDRSQDRFVLNRMSTDMEPTPLFPGIG